MEATLIAAVALLALANGANDNFKGVATLFGSGTADYRRALLWATATTLGGSLMAAALAGRLAEAFTGKGLVPDAVAREPAFLLSVGAGGAATVLLASLVGMPISTTHALTGALAGAGLVAAGASLDLDRLGGAFLAPLLLSPALAVAGVGVLYPLLRWGRCRLGVTRRTCLCLGSGVRAVVPAPLGRLALADTGVLLTVDEMKACRERYEGRVLGVGAQDLLDGFHYLSAGAVSFARGVNDTPKIVAPLLVLQALPSHAAAALAGLAIAAGGLLAARRVAETLSLRVTPMNHGQGFTVNLVTSLLVLGASTAGLPVSTTHVSCGAIFGLGAVTGGARWKTIAEILAAWVTTLPIAAAIGAGAYMLLRS